MKKTFIGYKDRIDYTEEMSFEEMGMLFNAILCYQNGKEIPNLANVKFVWSKIKKEMEQNEDKRNEICEKRRIAGKKGGENKGKNSHKAKIANASKGKQMKADSESDSDSVYTSSDVYEEIGDNKLSHKEYDQELTPTQKLIFTIVSSLCAERGYCRASNNYIAKLLGLGTTTVRDAISMLVKKGYLNTKIEKNEGNKRYLTLWQKFAIPMAENCHTYGEKLPHINTIDNYKGIIDKNNTKSFGEENELEERKEKSCGKKKRKKVEYTQDYETIWKIYPQNGGVKEKIFPLWQGYDDEKKEKLLFGAKVIRLRYMTGWRYVQRMDRWMEGYSPGEEFEKLCEVKRTIDNLKDDTLKESCYHELREMFGDEMNRKVAFATTKKIEFEWH